MSTLQVLGAAWALCAALMAILWVYQWRTRNATIVDVGWAAGIVASVILFAFLLADPGPRGWLAAALGAVWAARLFAYLYANRVHGRTEEDGRYRNMREWLGPRAQPAFFIFFQLQASWSVLFAIPILAVMIDPRPLGSLGDILGVAIWIAAVFGESIADLQLARFRANPANKGRTCRVGLWRYSRHPNYFFEWLHWFAYIPLAIQSPWWIATLMAPPVMLLFLFRVTGIPHTERQALATRGDDYRRYQQSTSPFIPWFPKEDRPS